MECRMSFVLLADDLTGALDTAARFVPSFGPLPVTWKGPWAAGARDLASREGSEEAAVAAHTACAAALRGASLSFKKLDSLLRGHPAAELAASFRAGGFDHLVIAPGFPFQGRITRGGRQLAHGVEVPVDLAGRLAALGLPPLLRRAGEAAAPGITLWDAETDADLLAIAASGRTLPGRVLWAGTGGLAGALAQGQVPRPDLPPPRLALIGSDHPVSQAQLAATARHHAMQGDRAPLPDLPAAISPALPPGLSRAEAAAQIASGFVAAAHRLPRPGSCIVAGGETLRALADGLGASALTVLGEQEPGAPVSRMEGGHWHGLPILSKSGAFGAPDFLARLLG
jgi:uncharacterized protein YgbK (DUF1537 family)